MATIHKNQIYSQREKKKKIKINKKHERRRNNTKQRERDTRQFVCFFPPPCLPVWLCVYFVRLRSQPSVSSIQTGQAAAPSMLMFYIILTITEICSTSKNGPTALRNVIAHDVCIKEKGLYVLQRQVSSFMFIHKQKYNITFYNVIIVIVFLFFFLIRNFLFAQLFAGPMWVSPHSIERLKLLIFFFFLTSA